MSITIAGQVGPQSLSDGVGQVFRMGRQSELIAQQLHAHYYESTFRKNRYSGGTGAVTTTAALATTYTGLVLTNPIGSPVNLVMDKVGYAPLVAQTAALILGLMTGFSASALVTQTTPVAPGGNFVGQGAGYGLLASSATLSGSPQFRALLDSLLTGAITVQAQGGAIVDLEGSIVIPPGGWTAFYTSAASVASSLAFSMQWEEVPVGG